MQMAQQAPLSKSLSVQNSAAHPLTLSDGFRAADGTTATTFAIDPHFRIGYAHSWQASIQRDLPGAMVLLASYLGTKGTRGNADVAAQHVPERRRGPLRVLLARVLLPGFQRQLDPALGSTASAAAIARRIHGERPVHLRQVDRRRRFWRVAARAPNVIAQDWLNLSAERGLSNFDQRHNVNAQVQYTTGSGSWAGAARQRPDGRLDPRVDVQRAGDGRQRTAALADGARGRDPAPESPAASGPTSPARRCIRQRAGWH